MYSAICIPTVLEKNYPGFTQPDHLDDSDWSRLRPNYTLLIKRPPERMK